MKKFSWSRLLPLLGFAMLVLVIWAARREMAEFHFRDVRAYLHSLPRHRVLLSLGATALGYLALTGYDFLSLRFVRRRLHYGRVALVSFISYAFSMNVGHSLVSGGSVRFRLYTEWGLKPAEIARIVLFCTVASFLGLGLLCGLLLWFEPFPLPPALARHGFSARGLGATLLLLTAGSLLACLVWHRPIMIRGTEFRLPSFKLALATADVAAFDWLMAGSALWVLMPREMDLPYTHFLGMFLIAQGLAVVSGAPGGIGVFESVLLLLLPKTIPSGKVLAALVAFRGIYYLLPLVLAAVAMGANELALRREMVSAQAARAVRFSGALVPRVFSLLIFVAGALLLFSGATPTMQGRLGWIERMLPLSLVETSHFLASLTGVGLLLLSHGLLRRLDAAYLLSLAMLTAGVGFSLIKGGDYEEAALLSLMIAALIPCRGHFMRRAALIHQRFTPDWWLAIGLVIAATVWLGLFSFRHVDYSNDLWWRFSLMEGDAPRFLRAMVGVVLALLVFAILQLMQPSYPDPDPTPEDIEQAGAIARSVDRSSAWLALLGDKHFLFNDQRTAFIMYATQGRSWVAMGDPIGPRESWDDLLWRFRETCEQHGGRTVFYQVDEENLRYYVDMGLSLFKLGEEGRVPLKGFNLEGGSRKALRTARNKMQREGCAFEVVPAGGTAAVMPELRGISDKWLAEKQQHEKGFSLGFFDEKYITQCPVGLVRHEGHVVAFANLWVQNSREEISIDLMRFDPASAPSGVMEFLFTELMLWGATEGYSWFSLGMTPLAGLESRRLAPLWHRLGAAVFRHGEHFYNFQGLRAYKQKFNPTWEARYLASPGGTRLPVVLIELTKLIGRRVE